MPRRNAAPFAPPLPLLLAALAGCEVESGVNAVYPDLAITPEAVDFGDVAVLYSDTQPVQLINAGLATLEISELSIESETPGVWEIDTTAPVQLRANEQMTVNVSFLPDTYLPYAGTLRIGSNDEENPEFLVPLTGTGVYAPTPDIEVDPLSWDFGAVEPPLVSFATINVANKGGAALTLGDVVQTGSSAFGLVGADPSGYSIPANQSLLLVYAYTPASTDGDSGTITIASDDPDEPETLVVLLGNGGGDYEYPTAKIDCPDSIAPRERVSLDGSGSSDPNGLALSYQWTLADTPDGSAVSSLENDTTSLTTLTPDIAGQYQVNLVVTNTVGISSAPATCKTDAIPDEELHVELSWDGSAADLDLHLMNAEDMFFSSPEDCNFCNQSPDWGTLLDINDDPSLDIDDQSGWGPENINIDVPVDGSYWILVHYFDDHGDESVVATMRLYSYGVIVAEMSHVMERDWVWAPGIVNWPEGTLGALDEYYDNVTVDSDGKSTQGPRDCF